MLSFLVALGSHDTAVLGYVVEPEVFRLFTPNTCSDKFEHNLFGWHVNLHRTHLWNVPHLRVDQSVKSNFRVREELEFFLSYCGFVRERVT